MPSRVVAVVALAALPALSSAKLPHTVVHSAAPRPNFVWIMADDLGYGEVGAFPGGSPNGRLATPRLDQFGAEGIRFTGSYSGYTVCGPSRTAMLTGYHVGSFPRVGLSEHIGKKPTAWDYYPHNKMLPGMLQAAGYVTVAFGKIEPLSSPAEQGFDYFIGQISPGLCHNMYPC